MAKSSGKRRWIIAVAVLLGITGFAVYAVNRVNQPPSATDATQTTTAVSAAATTPNSLDWSTTGSPSANEASVAPATTPTTAVSTNMAEVDTASLIQAVTTFESVYSSRSYTDTDSDRLAALSACKCVTERFKTAYAQLLQATADPNLEKHYQQIQRVIIGVVPDPSYLDVQSFEESTRESNDPTGHSLPAVVTATVQLTTTATDQPGPVFRFNTHQLTMVWSGEEWQADELPITT